MSLTRRLVFASSVVTTLAGLGAAVSAGPAEPVTEAKDHRWKVTGHDGACAAQDLSTCPADAHAGACKPPAPVAYACPEDTSPPFTIIRHAGSTECFYERHASGRGNPPPPMKLRCPE